jgi:hypothetical protein
MHNATEAQSYRPMKDDFILQNPKPVPPFVYPIHIPKGNPPGTIESPGAMGSPQPDDIKGENFHYTVLVFKKPHGEWVNGTGATK